MKQFNIISSSDQEEFLRKVQEHLEEQWELHGETHISFDVRGIVQRYVQAMTKISPSMPRYYGFPVEGGGTKSYIRYVKETDDEFMRGTIFSENWSEVAKRKGIPYPTTDHILTPEEHAEWIELVKRR